MATIMPGQIILIDDGGGILGHKPKNTLQPTDVYHGIFLLCITQSRRVVLSRIMTGGESRLSATAATIRQAGETPSQAAERALVKVIGGTLPLHHLGDQFYVSPEGRKMYMSVFYAAIGIAGDNKTCAVLTAEALDKQRHACTPAMQHIWSSYRHLLAM